RAQYDHRKRGGLVLDFPADFHARSTGETEVEHDGGRRVGAESTQTGRTVVRGINGVTFRFEQTLECFLYRSVVFYDQNLVHSGHPTRPREQRRGTNLSLEGKRSQATADVFSPTTPDVVLSRTSNQSAASDAEPQNRLLLRPQQHRGDQEPRKCPIGEVFQAVESS